ncbi:MULTISPECIES: aromatic-ring-hydroxylating dioxygenase subunit beta [unclassified Bradyrhizobium]|uniref:aromatic-ring-hydroxylating dioxygenase subunit beta n=1 Tax=unclassified Bradyrhizobium TaxID=2631580 RepID=UPI00244A1569|nr:MULTISPECIES: aromatic-ring-hydroxylating dioxygenase subunit beta [unclassified Bradyrhizobium]MDH2346141.1 aromatic-ring-hydroxylating dioxygenase subunit beta [Bradyrhizobium sp. SSUT77]MDH2350485.1 aromatic-ring-hydroxylating dioxygenase subunit beta [Bradyrhizobium sp. SSUT112]
MTNQAITLDEAMAFSWYEADLLDSAQYAEWLSLWTDDAHYVVPIEPGATDFENSLNYAYDDHAMREKRVSRLINGQSISASPVARTVRLQSRFRLLKVAETACELRCAQILTEFRRGRERNYTADVEFRLVRDGDKLKIAQKIVRLINSTDSLTGIGYIL